MIQFYYLARFHIDHSALLTTVAETRHRHGSFKSLHGSWWRAQVSDDFSDLDSVLDSDDFVDSDGPFLGPLEAGLVDGEADFLL
jgi:hypothetical protein